MKKSTTIIAMVTLVIMSFSFTSCDPLRSVLKLLEGDWDVTSFTEDGVELMNTGAGFSSFVMEFEEYGESEGEFSWMFILENGGSDVVSGDYELNDDGTEVEFTFKVGALTGTIAEFDMDLEGEDLELAGNINGFRWVIDAEKD